MGTPPIMQPTEMPQYRVEMRWHRAEMQLLRRVTWAENRIEDSFNIIEEKTVDGESPPLYNSGVIC